MENRKSRYIQIHHFYLLFIVCSLLSIGCDLFNGAKEDDLLHKIDNEVNWAAAAKLTQTRMAAGEGWLISSSPVSTMDIRKGFSFTVECEVSSAFGFEEWLVFPSGVYDELDKTKRAQEVESESLTGTSVIVNPQPYKGSGPRFAEITINTTVPVTIVPWCSARPYVRQSDPPLITTTLTYTRTKDIRIYFSTDMDVETLIFGPGFIEISGQALVEGEIWNDPQSSFEAPMYNSNLRIATISPSNTPDLWPPENALVTVTLGTSIKAVNGYGLSSPVTISYSTNAEKITMAYKANKVWAIHDPDTFAEDLFFFRGGPKEADRRLQKLDAQGNYQVTLYFHVTRSSSEIEEPTPDSLFISEVQFADLNGEEESDYGRLIREEEVPFKPMEYTEGSAGRYYQEINTEGSYYYTAVYTWDKSLPEPKQPQAGIIRLVIRPYRNDVSPVSPDSWVTAVSEGRFVSVVFDDEAPGGSGSLSLDGYQTHSGNVYYYNETNSTLSINADLSNIKDNSGNGIPLRSASLNKPWTMEEQATIQWQYRLVTNPQLPSPTVHYEHSGWLGFNQNPPPLDLHDLELAGKLTNVVTTRDVQVRYRDSLGNTGEWENIERFVYYTPNIDPVSVWSAEYYETQNTSPASPANSIRVTWTMPSGASGVEVQVNNESPQTSSAASGLHTILDVPRIDTSGVRSGNPVSNVSSYTIKLTAYNNYGRAETVEFKIWNIPGMIVQSTATAPHYSNTVLLDNTLTQTEFRSRLTSNLTGVTNFALASDIVLGSAWTPVNLEGRNFYGNGYTVTINNIDGGSGSDLPNRGLFGAASNAVIRDLTVEHNFPSSPTSFFVRASAETNIGGIVGSVSGVENTTQILNCIVRGTTLRADLSFGSAAVHIGGIAGNFEGSGKIENCRAALPLYFIASVHYGIVRIGGIAGRTGEGGTENTIAMNNGYTLGIDEQGPTVTLDRLLINGVTVAADITANKFSNGGSLAVGGAVGRSDQNTMNDIEFAEGTVSFNRGSVSAANNIGGIVGYSMLTNIINSAFYGSIRTTTASEVLGNLRVAGIVGYNEINAAGNYFINNCRARMDLKIKGDDTKNIGGILGYSYRTNGAIIITNSFFEGGDINISGTDGIFQIGGFAGYMNGTNQILYNCGVLSGTITATTDVAADSNFQIGGFISISNGAISNCFSRMDIDAYSLYPYQRNNVGGFMAYLQPDGSISSCYATGTVRFIQSGDMATSPVRHVNVGGLVGWKEGGTISDSYALGHVIADKQSGRGRLNAGGLVGLNEAGEISNCFSTGLVTAQSNHSDGAYAGGLVGYREAGTFTNNAVLGASVTAKGGTRAAGRISGYPTTTTAIGSGNRAKQSMRVEEGTYTQLYIDPPVSVGEGNAAQRHGATYSDSAFFDLGFWSGTGNLNFSADYWNFYDVGREGHPRLRNMDGQ